MKAPSENRAASSVGKESLTDYLTEIGRYPTLTLDEERLLTSRIQSGDTEALNALVRANLRFVVSMARKYANRGVALGDLIGEGNLGLVVAAERFDGARGVKFITYAVWWIKQALNRVIGEQGYALKVPSSQSALVYRTSRRAAELAQTLQREPSLREILADTGLGEQETLSALAAARPPLSLDSSADDNETYSLHSRIGDESAAIDDESEDCDATNSLKSAIASLRGRESQVLAMYFGLDGTDPQTLEVIASTLGITRERVRQIKLKALSRLRKDPHLRALAS